MTVETRQNGAYGATVHELHNLISVIVAEAQLLQLEYPPNDPRHDSAVAIERAGRRLEMLLEGLAIAQRTEQTSGQHRAEEQTELAGVSLNGAPTEPGSGNNGSQRLA